MLLDRRGLGVALHDDEATQVGAVLSGHVLPHGLALVRAEADAAVGLGLGEEDPPAVLGHLDVSEVRPTLLADVDRSAEVHVAVLVALGTELVPPFEEPRLPTLERALQPTVARQVDVVRDPFAVVDHRDLTLGFGRTRDARRCRSGAVRLPVPTRSDG